MASQEPWSITNWHLIVWLYNYYFLTAAFNITAFINRHCHQESGVWDVGENPERLQLQELSDTVFPPCSYNRDKGCVICLWSEKGGKSHLCCVHPRWIFSETGDKTTNITLVHRREEGRQSGGCGWRTGGGIHPSWRGREYSLFLRADYWLKPTTSCNRMQK